MGSLNEAVSDYYADETLVPLIVSSFTDKKTTREWDLTIKDPALCIFTTSGLGNCLTFERQLS